MSEIIREKTSNHGWDLISPNDEFDLVKVINPIFKEVDKSVQTTTDMILQSSHIGEIKEFDYTGISTAVLPTVNRFDTLARVQAHFGGVWEVYGGGQVLVGQNATFPIGITGGASRATLSANQMPRHHHTDFFWNGQMVKRAHSGSGIHGVTMIENSAPSHGISFTTGGHGGNESHENMPPFRTVFRWRRIA